MLLNVSKITRKKRTTLYQERNEIARASFIEKLEKIPIEDRIYLDESVINQYLHREYGKGLRGKKVFGEFILSLRL